MLNIYALKITVSAPVPRWRYSLKRGGGFPVTPASHRQAPERQSQTGWAIRQDQ